MKVAILTSPNQWFETYAEKLATMLKRATLYKNHSEINGNYDVLFILSYHEIIPTRKLKMNKHNVVIHASLLPKGKGWAPLFWRVLEGQKTIPFTMFEAEEGVDSGNIYMVKNLNLTGYELNPELREKQANLTLKMSVEFIENYDKYKTPKKQHGEESFYTKRTSEQSELNVDKSLREQFNLLRVVNNEEYPAFFKLDGQRYILKIEQNNQGGVELIDFVDLTLDEKLMVLEWRNNPTIKEWMYSQDDISLEEHLTFISSLLLNFNKQYFLVKKDGNYIGVITFTKINSLHSQCYFGIYSNPFQKMSGLGKILIETSIKYVFELLKIDTIRLEVFTKNCPAINLYKKYGFIETEQKQMNGQKIICMEKINEN